MPSEYGPIAAWYSLFSKKFEPSKIGVVSPSSRICLIACVSPMLPWALM
jgi:hypothetical protein